MTETDRQALLDRAVIRCKDRTVSHTWLGVQDGDGNAPGIRLEVCHDKARKLLTATFYRFTRQQRDGYAVETHEIRFAGDGLPNSKRYAATPCARYSDKALATFDAAVRDHLVQDPDPCGRFVDEAASLAGVTA
jgi:hypothetical protein